MKDWRPKTPRSRKEWSPKPSCSANAIVREHSPYCEATGPIVQEGFVAARVRALQHLQDNGNTTIRSHSPTAPCPRPWTRTCEAHSHPSHALTPTPASIASSRRRIYAVKYPEIATPLKGHQISSSEASARSVSRDTLLPPLENARGPRLIPELSGSQTALLQTSHSEDVSVDDTFSRGMQRSSETENQIFSPRALPAKLADPSKTLGFLQQNGLHDSEPGHEQSRRPIAERLGSMVERGWVGMDVFGKSYNDRKTSDPISSTSDDRVKRRSQSLGDEPLVEPPPYKRTPFPPTSKDQSYQSQTIHHKVPHTQEEEERSLKDHVPRKKAQRQAKSIATSRHVLQRSSSDTALYRSQSFFLSPAGKTVWWSQHRSHRLRRTQSHASELSTPVSTNATDGFKPDVDHKAATMSSAMTIEPASIAPSSRRSSTNTQKSARSISQATRWKLRWPRFVPVDSQKAGRGHSRIEPVGSASSRATKGAQQNPIPLNHLARDKINTHKLADCGHGDGAAETNLPLNHDICLDGRKEHESDVLVSHYHSSMAQSHRVNEPQASEQSRVVTDTSSSALLGRFEDSMPWWEQSLDETSPATTRHSPQRSFNPNKASTKVRKRPSMSTSTYGTFETAPCGNSTESSQETSSEITQHSLTSSQVPTPMISHSLEATQGSPSRLPSSTSAVSDNIRTKDWPELFSPGPATANPGAVSNTTPPGSQHPKSSDQAIKRSSASTGPSTASVQVSGLPKTVNREMKSSGKGIKRIQVTVTFDGVADLVIDARLDPRDEHEAEGDALVE